MCSPTGVNASVFLKSLLAYAVSLGLFSVQSAAGVPSVSSVACVRFFRALFRGGIFRGLFNGNFFRAHVQAALSVVFFRRGFLHDLFCIHFLSEFVRRRLFRVLFCRGFLSVFSRGGGFRALSRVVLLVRYFTEVFCVRFFLGLLHSAPSQGFPSVRVFAGAFSVRSVLVAFFP